MRNKNKITDESNGCEEVKKIIKGKPKSGRVWKTQKSRCRSVIKTPGLQCSFLKKQKLRMDLKRVKEASKTILKMKEKEKQEKKERRRANLLRQEENRKKSEIVQVIKNPLKIKRMKKKMLKTIEKRDIVN